MPCGLGRGRRNGLASLPVQQCCLWLALDEHGIGIGIGLPVGERIAVGAYVGRLLITGVNTCAAALDKVCGASAWSLHSL